MYERARCVCGSDACRATPARVRFANFWPARLPPRLPGEVADDRRQSESSLQISDRRRSQVTSRRPARRALTFCAHTVPCGSTYGWCRLPPPLSPPPPSSSSSRSSTRSAAARGAQTYLCAAAAYVLSFGVSAWQFHALAQVGAARRRAAVVPVSRVQSQTARRTRQLHAHEKDL